MSIKEIMKIGYNGHTEAEQVAEMERRLMVAERINKLYEKISNCEDEKKKKRLKKQFATIKAEESYWLKKVAWFIY